MFTVALLSQNGGVGKTTLAVTLAVQAELAGRRVGIIDADPSANAGGWHKERQSKHGKTTPALAAAAEPAKLRAAVKAAKADKFDFLFIDTAAGVAELPAVAAELADLVLIPILGTRNKMRGAAPTARLVKRIGKPGFFVLNRGRASKAINDACAMTLVSAYGLPAAEAYIQHRLPIGDIEDEALTLPESVAKDSSTEAGKRDFVALWKWLEGRSRGDNDDE